MRGVVVVVRLVIALVLGLTPAIALVPDVGAIGAPPGGINLPAGSTATFSAIDFGGCNSLSWGYQLSDGTGGIQASNVPNCGSTPAPDVTIGPFPTSTSILVFLQDNTCGRTFYSDGSPVDHVIVSGNNPYTMRFADTGGFCERTGVANDFTGYNLTVTLTLDDDLALTNVPSDIAANATSPAGAVVAYTPPTAVDEEGPTPTPTCSPASGSTFPIGTTTVECSVSDPDDSPATATFSVTVEGAAHQLQDLSGETQGVGPGTSLSDKVALVQADLAAGDITDACGTLGAFINSVQAQSDKSIAAAQASGLIADAQRIEAVVGC